jgi:hypothetical protein
MDLLSVESGVLPLSDEKKTFAMRLMFSPSEIKAIEDWQFANRISSRSEAIRRLIAIGLTKEETPHN